MSDRRRAWVDKAKHYSREQIRDAAALWSDGQLHAAADYCAGIATTDGDQKAGQLGATLREVWLSRGETVRQARADIQAKLQHGGMVCPCCNRNAQARRRKLSALIAVSIVWLVRRAEWQAKVCNPVIADPASEPGKNEPERMRAAGWVHWQRDCPHEVYRNHEISRLVVWGLAEECTSPGWSGWYRPTAAGRGFVRAGVRVPAEAWTWNKGVLAFSAETVSLNEAMGTRFVLADILSADMSDGTQWVPTDTEPRL